MGAPRFNPMKKLRLLTLHHAGGPESDFNTSIEIAVLDKPGAGGACHSYLLKISPDAPRIPGRSNCVADTILHFQKGPVSECGVNGISMEAVLAVAIDRLSGFQTGPDACHENEMALQSILTGLRWLKYRAQRIARQQQHERARIKRAKQRKSQSKRKRK